MRKEKSARKQRVIIIRHQPSTRGMPLLLQASCHGATIRGAFWGAFWGSETCCILEGAQEIASLKPMSSIMVCGVSQGECSRECSIQPFEGVTKHGVRGRWKEGNKKLPIRKPICDNSVIFFFLLFGQRQRN